MKSTKTATRKKTKQVPMEVVFKRAKVFDRDEDHKILLPKKYVELKIILPNGEKCIFAFDFGSNQNISLSVKNKNCYVFNRNNDFPEMKRDRSGCLFLANVGEVSFY